MAFIVLYADQEEARRIARLTLEYLGYDVLTFADEPALLAALPELQAPPELVVADLSTSERAASLWARLGPVLKRDRVPLLLIAPTAPEGEGPADVLLKPYALRELQARVRRLLTERPTPA